MPSTAEIVRRLPVPETDALTPAEIEAKVATNFGLSEVCEGRFTLDPACRTSDTPAVLIWGDSFAMHLVPALMHEVDGGLIQMTKSVCIPAIGVSVVTSEYPATWAERCVAFNDQVLDWLATQPSIQTVVVSSPLGLIFNDVYLRDGTVAQAPRPDLVADAMRNTAERVRAMGKQFVVVSPPPVTGEDIGQCLVQAALRDQSPGACDFPVTEIHRLSRMVLDFLEDLSAEVPVVSLEPLICNDTVCDTRIGETFLFRDTGHLSVEGARLLGRHHNLYGLIRHAARQ
ncbi:SGNH hydrolase domain-containing protein [Thalassorhabdomicrobium marinisediminis]|uniref:SGNH hydrolase domain-containing protein n=1 Tax=Thalassorhabdomicrobium marinisediminis TaxID=2170577 RepID=UPI0011B1E2EB|nr:SGNH hydrolase domain-containing protein [Thalassorhabdomicrobium marinisediminis]